MSNSRRVKYAGSDRAFRAVNTVFLLAIFLVTLYPIVYVLSASFSDPKALFAGKVVLWPVGFSLEGYKAVFQYRKVWTGFSNSLLYASLGTLINVAVTVLAAYPLSRKDFRGRNKVTLCFAFTMWFSGGLIPTFLLVKGLGLYNSIWAMLLPGAMSVYNMLIVKTYFENTIPGELLESARLDGCDDFRFLFKIVIPLSGPVLAVIGLFYAVGHWNSYFSALIYLNNEKLFPIQIVLRDVLIFSTTQTITGDMALQAEREFLSELLKNSMIVVASLPVIAVYPFVQRFFVKGMMIGAVKG